VKYLACFIGGFVFGMFWLQLLDMLAGWLA
jgi:hypothetical protein